MLSYAEEREVEEATRPLWIAHYAVQKIAGADPMPYDEFLLSILSDEAPEVKAPAKRSAEEIEEEFLRIVEISRGKEG